MTNKLRVCKVLFRGSTTRPVNALAFTDLWRFYGCFVAIGPSERHVISEAGFHCLPSRIEVKIQLCKIVATILRANASVWMRDSMESSLQLLIQT